jgi:hypothetical protein
MTTPTNNPEDAAHAVDGGAPVVPSSEAATPEHQAVTTTPDTEPAFARVPRPSPTPPADTAQTSWDTTNSDWMSGGGSGGSMLMWLGWVGLGLGSAAGAWLWLRWQREQRERNKPINRLRRQARDAAGQARVRATALREQMPDLPEFPVEARRPAVGLGTALLGLAVIVWQQAQARSREEQAAREASERAAAAVSEGDWAERLQHLRDLWNPDRVELEKISIPRR